MSSLYFTGGNAAPPGLAVDADGNRCYTLPLSLSASMDENQANACSVLMVEMRKHLDVLALQQWLLSLANVWEQEFPQWQHVSLAFEEDASNNLQPFVRVFCQQGTAFWEPGRIEMALESGYTQATWATGWGHSGARSWLSFRPRILPVNASIPWPATPAWIQKPFVDWS